MIQNTFGQTSNIRDSVNVVYMNAAQRQVCDAQQKFLKITVLKNRLEHVFARHCELLAAVRMHDLCLQALSIPSVAYLKSNRPLLLTVCKSTVRAQVRATESQLRPGQKRSPCA